METRNIKDFIHLYFGCRCQFEDIRNEDTTDVGVLIEVGKDFAVIKDGKGIENEVMLFEVKPILRPLSSMSDDEKWDLLSFIGYDLICDIDVIDISFINPQAKDDDRFAPEVYYKATLWFLKHHFDLYGLIEAGLAIDATTINHTP